MCIVPVRLWLASHPVAATSTNSSKEPWKTTNITSAKFALEIILLVAASWQARNLSFFRRRNPRSGRSPGRCLVDSGHKFDEIGR